MELWSRFQTRCQTYHETLKYLDDTWISSHKENFVAARTNKVTHFEHAVTSRGESAHSRLKTYLGTRMLDLLQCCKRIKLSIESFLTDYLAKRTNYQTQTPMFAYPSPKTDIFQNVAKSVSNFALSKVNEKASQRRDGVCKV